MTTEDRAMEVVRKALFDVYLRKMEAIRRALFEVYLRTMGNTAKEVELHAIAWKALKESEPE